MPNLSNKSYSRRKLILKWRRFLGICVSCGAEANGNSKCDRCQAKSVARTKARRKALKESGMCCECGRNKVNGGEYQCGGCLQKMRSRRKPLQCHTEGCYNKIAKNHSYCDICITDRHLAKQVCKVYFIECIECSVLFTSRYQSTACCDDCRHDRSKRLNTEYKRMINKLIPLTKTCDNHTCNKTFTTYKQSQITCSKLCSNRIHKRASNKRRRSIKRGAKHIERVDLKVLFIRDGGRCQICNKKLNLTRPNNHPLQATHDHIVSLGMGGENSYKNAQLACRQCNTNKGHLPTSKGDQLLLFG